MHYLLIRLTTLVFFLALASFDLIAQKTITMKGSDTMVILAQRWAEIFMQKNKDITIQVTGGGSGTGISSLINGTTDICNSSRSMKSSEREKLKERYGSGGIEIKAARDGIAIYINEKNPVKELTIEQIRKIYTGEISNWKQVGGVDASIILYSRENNSGTYVSFKELILEGSDFSSKAQNMPGTAAVVSAITKDIHGIGYGGAAYGKGIKYIKVRKDKNSNSYAPTPENIKNGNYPVSRFLFLYVKARPEGEMKKFIDWILSSEGQNIATEVGFFPIR